MKHGNRPPELLQVYLFGNEPKISKRLTKIFCLSNLIMLSRYAQSDFRLNFRPNLFKICRKKILILQILLKKCRSQRIFGKRNWLDRRPIEIILCILLMCFHNNNIQVIAEKKMFRKKTFNNFNNDYLFNNFDSHRAIDVH